ncbi:hypothetical protein C3Y87_12795 [Carbonactinospora thermoautotrophica]|uniref:hypothetical protein n=1 Tax=Carbonactinospora thermoautotrophica TaxID=1469144 RepID=UPI00226F1361|nr:hypothetical protein [Carbonactinospora thermoautotrophica]MCX9192275.1 hypothetical protein [Carbonactinospora thermoautotrophica]
MIDAEESRLDLPVRDFVRLLQRACLDRPDLEQAVLACYGRPLNDTEQWLLPRLAAISAASALVWGTTHGDPEITTAGRLTLTHLTQTIPERRT